MAAWDNDPVVTPVKASRNAWDSDPVLAAAPAPTSAPKQSTFDAIKQGAGDLAAGAVRGAGSIGATILAPADMVNSALEGNGFFNLDKNRERRAQMDQGLEAMGADPASGMYATGKIGTEIAGTLGVGGVLAKGAMAVGKALPAIAHYMPKLATALESGGFRINPASMVGPLPAANLASRAGDMALRTGAGAAVGGSAAGAIDPSQAGAGAVIGGAIPGGVKVAGAIGTGIKDAAGAVVRNAVGGLTGAGGESMRGAFNAGKSGAQSFVDNMRGKVDSSAVVDQARQGVQTIRQGMYDAYAKAKGGWGADVAPLDFAPITQAYDDAAAKFSFKGVPQPGVEGVKQKVEAVLGDWVERAKADPEFMTVSGLDALKRHLATITPDDVTNRAGRSFVSEVVDSVKQSIIKQRPEYAKAMKDYWRSSSQIDEIERGLSLGQKASVDTSLRKLQSLMRNNVNTNYGNRLNLAKQIEEQGGADLLPAVAGQALSSATPRGLQGLGATATGVYGLTNPLALAALPFQSPRLMGELFYGAGRATGKTSMTLKDLMQTPALAGGAGWLGSPGLSSMATIAPSVAFSR